MPEGEGERGVETESERERARERGRGGGGGGDPSDPSRWDFPRWCLAARQDPPFCWRLFLVKKLLYELAKNGRRGRGDNFLARKLGQNSNWFLFIRFRRRDAVGTYVLSMCAHTSHAHVHILRFRMEGKCWCRCRRAPAGITLSEAMRVSKSACSL